MSFSKFQETIALTSGVLVLSIAVGYFVFAWNEPKAALPWNLSAPINTGPDAQTKQGALAVSSLFVSNRKVFLNDDGEEGDIERVDYIKGRDGLYLDSDTFNTASIYLDEQNKEIKFSIGGEEKMKIDKDGKMHIPKLSNCFLEADENGKIRCYAKGQIPDGDELLPFQTKILHIGKSGSDSWTILDEEAVIKITANMSAYCQAAMHFKFYINGVEKEHLDVSGGEHYDPTWGWDCWWRSASETWYYHVKQGDVVEITTDWSYWPDYASGSASVYKLNYKRDVIDYASCEGTILYYYDKNSTGKMNEIENQYYPDVPVSVALASDGLPISFPTP